MDRFPLASETDYGPWIERFKGLQNSEEVRNTLLQRWQLAKHPEILRIGKRILETWTPVGVAQDQDTPFPKFNLVLFPIGESSLYSIEFDGSVRDPKDRKLSVEEEFFLNFGMIKYSSGAYMLLIRPEPTMNLAGEWQESSIIFCQPDGDPLLVSKTSGRVGSFFLDGTFKEMFANSFEDAVFHILGIHTRKSR